jgi:hypothetical protein
MVEATFVDSLAQGSKSTWNPNWDPKVAYFLSVAAGWAYSDGQTLSNKMTFYGFPENTVDEFAIVNPAMFVVARAFLIRNHNDEVGVLVFRGTEPTSLINWLLDADFEAKVFEPNSGAQVHNGFYGNVEAVWDDICERLSALREKLKVLYITGHSLGGAMAVLTAVKLLQSAPATGQSPASPPIRGVYTYGQPAVGDRSLKRLCEGQDVQWNGLGLTLNRVLFRHVFNNDIVPCLPPKTPLFPDGFVHFGQEYHSMIAPNAGGNIWRHVHMPAGDPAATILEPAVVIAFLDIFLRRSPILRHLGLPYSIDDHRPIRYVETSRLSIGNPAPIGISGATNGRRRMAETISRNAEEWMQEEMARIRESILNVGTFSAVYDAGKSVTEVIREGMRAIFASPTRRERLS